MARGIIRKPSFNKIVGAYRSQWKRFWMRLFTFGMYGRKGMGWWRDPKKAWYNFWYNRSSISVYRILGCKPSRGACFFAMLCASVVSIFAAPVDATRAGVTAHKIKKERKARAEGTSSRSSGTRTSTSSSPRSASSSYSSSERSSPRTYSEPKKTTTPPRTTSTSSSSYSSTARSTTSRITATNSHKPTAPRKTTTTTSIKITPPVVEEKKKETYSYSYTSLFPKPEPAPYVPPKPEEPKEPDENTPKSTPKHEGDQYIRKRMIIAGSSYCDKAALDKLAIGTYFELVAEPTNPYDKDAVMLVHEGEKIGYIAKKDKLAFVTCLKLKRKVYGVITDIITEPYPTKYEYETWFDYERK
jgi:hypothetical protein